jgi:uncharacterized repeat protein (TIGR03803 family)
MYCSPRSFAGIASLFALAAGPQAASAATFTSLYSFGAQGGADAANPYAGVIIDSAGNLYGTTYGGGTEGEGTVYELSPPAAGQTAWTETILYSFYTNRTDGVKPTGRLVFGSGGVLYGTTTSAGGPNANEDGTVFALTPPATSGAPWTESTLHAFSQTKGDGGLPEAGLAIDANGVLYGTTNRGGLTKKTGPGYGTVFSLAPPAGGMGSWTETILYEFSNTSRDGIAPQSDLLLSNGALYGTTPDCSSKLSCSGTVFQLTGSGASWTESVILAFPSNGDKGASPYGSLSTDASGALYGTTSLVPGTAFRLTPPAAGQTKWTQSVLAKFGSDKDGGPQGGLLPGPGGVLYGTLTYGAKKAQGSVYELTPTGSGPWTQTALYSFPSKPTGGGSYPVGDLVADPSGNLYGVTEIGGQYGVGTVFEITP